MDPKIAKQVEALLKGAAPSDIAEVEKMVAEAKNRLGLGTGTGFWEGKTPCWEMTRCPEMIRSNCPAPKKQTVPCWQIEGTYCKLTDYGTKGDDTRICEVCRVYKTWGMGEPIKITLTGKGFDSTLRSGGK
jgi:hypothetical protein